MKKHADMGLVTARRWPTASVGLLALASGCGGELTESEMLDQQAAQVRRTEMLMISEFQVGPTGFIEIVNGGDDVIDLRGYSVDDRAGGARPLALSGTIDPHSVRAFDYAEINSRSADEVRLIRPGRVVDSIPNGHGNYPDGPELSTMCFQRWIAWYVVGGEGLAPGPCSRDRPNSNIQPGDLVINEFRTGAGGFVEIRNAGMRTITSAELVLLRIEDGPGRTGPGMFWGATDLAPGAMLQVHYRGIIGTSAEPVQLISPEGLILDQHDNFFRRGAPPVTGRCFGRRLDLSWVADSIECTPGQQNFPGEGQPIIVINEFQAGTNGFVELYNGGAGPVDLQGWAIDDVVDGGGSPRRISGVTLDPGGFAAITYGAVNRSSLDEVRVIDSLGNTIDQRTTNGAPGTACFGRAPDGGSWLDAPLARCSPGVSNGGAAPPPRGCTATGGAYHGVSFTAEEECRALAMLNQAPFSELFDIGQIAAETAYFCDRSGCGTYRRGRWASLAEYDVAEYGGGTPGAGTFENLRSSSSTYVDHGSVQGDTIASSLAHREALVPRQIIFERVYIDRLYAAFGPDQIVCARVTDQPGGSDYLRFCPYLTSCHDGSCSGPTPPDLSQHVRTYVWIQGRFNRSGSSYNVHNLWLQQPAFRFSAEGGQPEPLTWGQVPVLRFPASREALAAAQVAVSYPATAHIAIYQVDPATLGAIIGDPRFGAFSWHLFLHATGEAAWWDGSDPTGTPVVGDPLQALAEVVAADDFHTHGMLPNGPEALRPLVESMLAGSELRSPATKLYAMTTNDGDDMSHQGLAAINTDTGRAQVITLSNHPPSVP